MLVGIWKRCKGRFSSHDQVESAVDFLFASCHSLQILPSHGYVFEGWRACAQRFVCYVFFLWKFARPSMAWWYCAGSSSTLATRPSPTGVLRSAGFGSLITLPPALKNSADANTCHDKVIKIFKIFDSNTESSSRQMHNIYWCKVMGFGWFWRRLHHPAAQWSPGLVLRFNL